MPKYLPVFILVLFLFAAASAQTPADTLANHQAVDSAAKSKTVDTLVKPAAADSVAAIKSLKDSIAKLKTVADSAAKPVRSDSVPKRVNADSVVKHPSIDSVTKLKTVDNIAKPLPVDSVAKRPVVDSASAHPIAENVVKHTPVKTAVKHPVVVEPVIIHSPIKTLSDRRYNAYLKGEDLDSMAMVGEINHYPLPDQALKYKVQLGLNPGQITKLKDMAATLHRKKVEMGENIIRNEKMLDSLFHSKRIEDGTLIFYTNRSGLYFGELRGAILMACYKTEEILSDDQIKKLMALEKVN